MADASELSLIGLGDRLQDEATPSPSGRSELNIPLEAAGTGATGTTEPAGAKSSDDEDLVPVPGATFAELPVGIIVPNPRQPRQVFDEDDISELAAVSVSK